MDNISVTFDRKTLLDSFLKPINKFCSGESYSKFYFEEGFISSICRRTQGQLLFSKCETDSKVETKTDEFFLNDFGNLSRVLELFPGDTTELTIGSGKVKLEDEYNVASLELLDPGFIPKSFKSVKSEYLSRATPTAQFTFEYDRDMQKKLSICRATCESNKRQLMFSDNTVKFNSNIEKHGNNITIPISENLTGETPESLLIPDDTFDFLIPNTKYIFYVGEHLLRITTGKVNDEKDIKCRLDYMVARIF